MRHAALVLVFISVATVAHAHIDGSVYLYRNIGPDFTSSGTVHVRNDLGQVISAVLSGTHRVAGPQTFETEITGDGSYFYLLQGPAQANQCYTTDMHVVADPPGWWNTEEQDVFGEETVCWVVASAPPPPQHTQCVASNNECQDPLVLDLNGDGIHTTSIADSVSFDMDGDGRPEQIAWTNPDTAEGFLYLDLDHKGRVTSGRELFGVGTVMPDGSRGRDGFTALRVYDDPAQGGNSDGIIDARDAIWNRLRIWVDENHNGVCDPSETGPIHKYGVREIVATYAVMNRKDGDGNLHFLTSLYSRQTNGTDRQDFIQAIAFQRAQ